MKKFRWFTLLESLAVIGIIWIISTALYNMRNVWKDYTDYKKEAVNIIYKEIDQSIKSFQRNKIRKDSQWNEHEIDSFQIKIADNEDQNTWLFLEIGNTYTYCIDNNWNIIKCLLDLDILQWSWFYESKTLISWWIYNISQNVKKIKQYNFYVSISGFQDINTINIWKNWEIYPWDNIAQHTWIIYNAITSNDQPINTEWGVSPENTCKTRYEFCTSTSQDLTEKEKQYIWQQNNWWAIWFILWIFWIHTWNPNITENSIIESKTKKCLWNNFYTICSEFFNWFQDVEQSPINNQIKQQIPIKISAEKDDDCQNIWIITINSITKKVTLELCNNNEQNWIDCGEPNCPQPQ